MAIRDYIVQQQNLDLVTDSKIQMWHGLDFVVLKGPITVAVTQMHRQSTTAPFEYEPTYTIKIHDGQTRRIACEEYTGTHPGDWNTEIVLVSED